MEEKPKKYVGISINDFYVEWLEEKLKEFSKLGNEFDRMHKMVPSRYVAERIFTIELGAP